MIADVQFHALSGAMIEPWLEAIGELRIGVFKEYPYLYEGTLVHEAEYLKRYVRAEGSLVVVVTDGEGRPVGVTTSLPMAVEDPPFREPFERAGIPLEQVFYFGESILVPEWRGMGIGKRFFEMREAHARRLGHAITAFCAVDRPDDHPKKPATYRALDGFWRSRGYEKRPALQASLSWKEIDESQETLKTLTFWTREGV